MLKIKEEYSTLYLQYELPKYGFTFIDTGESDTYYKAHFYKDIENYTTIYIQSDNKRIYGDFNEGKSLTKKQLLKYKDIQDLIQVGLVEKV